MKIRAKKSLGQNFLIDNNILKIIVDCAEIEDKEILEVGPGTGNLTNEILKKKPKRLFLIEKDNNLINVLKKRFDNKVIYHNEDILNFSIEKLSDTKLTVKCLKPSEMKQQILDKNVDGVCVWNPYLRNLLSELPHMQHIWDFSDVRKWGYETFAMLVGTETFLNDDDNKEIIDRIIRVLATLDNDLAINKAIKSHWKLSKSKLLQT